MKALMKHLDMDPCEVVIGGLIFMTASALLIEMFVRMFI